ncbi:DUF6587 family protein [Acetobacter sp.]|jgi:hypothetical protein|uniref:DUF6587 family protein n=1 Tax=Acetobacter sp. TaxID=440 RepID=UPI0025BBE96C|nr:DUF6587 family protein [Acetobacter sp.]MCH4091640.1 hypothetical protein [Acetobacter sp.]MCI1300942.1 hypothetical protein [Acetobacter sp.]MCI1316181.1 hypothetical protein [Acetobacter sp.]
MIQSLIIGLLVLVCALYWLGRLAPSVTRRLWKGAQSVLRAVHAPAVLQTAVAGRADAGSRGGCGGCKGCDSKGGGCH